MAVQIRILRDGWLSESSTFCTTSRREHDLQPFDLDDRMHIPSRQHFFLLPWLAPPAGPRVDPATRNHAKDDHDRVLQPARVQELQPAPLSDGDHYTTHTLHPTMHAYITYILLLQYISFTSPVNAGYIPTPQSFTGMCQKSQNQIVVSTRAQDAKTKESNEQYRMRRMEERAWDSTTIR
jgi:hypothetical protein